MKFRIHRTLQSAPGTLGARTSTAMSRPLTPAVRPVISRSPLRSASLQMPTLKQVEEIEGRLRRFHSISRWITTIRSVGTGMAFIAGLTFRELGFSVESQIIGAVGLLGLAFGLGEGFRAMGRRSYAGIAEFSGRARRILLAFTLMARKSIKLRQQWDIHARYITDVLAMSIGDRVSRSHLLLDAQDVALVRSELAEVLGRLGSFEQELAHALQILVQEKSDTHRPIGFAELSSMHQRLRAALDQLGSPPLDLNRFRVPLSPGAFHRWFGFSTPILKAVNTEDEARALSSLAGALEDLEKNSDQLCRALVALPVSPADRGVFVKLLTDTQEVLRELRERLRSQEAPFDDQRKSWLQDLLQRVPALNAAYRDGCAALFHRYRRLPDVYAEQVREVVSGLAALRSEQGVDKTAHPLWMWVLDAMPDRSPLHESHEPICKGRRFED